MTRDAVRDDAIRLLVLGVFVIVQFVISPVLTSQCFAPPVNHIFSSSQEDFYCPWYRNLVRHIPMEEGRCPSSSIYRKHKNCLSDNDCLRDTYCCFSVCHGITRCYNPYTNEWAEKSPESTYKSPCPLIQLPEPNKTTVLHLNETATVKPKSVASVSMVDEDEEPTTRHPEEPKSSKPTELPAVAKPEIIITEKPLMEITTDWKVPLDTTMETTPGEKLEARRTTGMPATTEAPTEQLASAEDVKSITTTSDPRLLTTIVEIPTTTINSLMKTLNPSTQASSLTSETDVELQSISPENATLEPESTTPQPEASARSNQKPAKGSGIWTEESGGASSTKNKQTQQDLLAAITENSTMKNETLKSSSGSSSIRNGNSSQQESLSISTKNSTGSASSSSMKTKNFTKMESSSSANKSLKSLISSMLSSASSSNLWNNKTRSESKSKTYLQDSEAGTTNFDFNKTFKKIFNANKATGDVRANSKDFSKQTVDQSEKALKNETAHASQLNKISSDKNSSENGGFSSSSEKHAAGFTKANDSWNNSDAESKIQRYDDTDSDKGASESDKGEKIPTNTNTSGTRFNSTARSKNGSIVTWSPASPSSAFAMKSNKSTNKSSRTSQQKQLLSERSQSEAENQHANLKHKSDSASPAGEIISETSQSESAEMNSEKVGETGKTTVSKDSIKGRSTGSSAANIMIMNENKDSEARSISKESDDKNSSDAQAKSLQGETDESSQNEANGEQEAEAPVSEKSSVKKISTRTETVTNSSSSSHSSSLVQKSSASKSKLGDMRSGSGETESSSGSINSKERGESTYNSESSSSSDSDSQQHFNRDFFADRGVNAWDSSKFGTQLPPFQPMTPLVPPLLEIGNLPNINFAPMTMPGIPQLKLLELPALPDLPELPQVPKLPDLPQLPELPKWPSPPAFPELPSLPEPPPLESQSKPRDE